MKAYILSHLAPLVPFDQPASKIELHRERLEQRLERQLKKVGFEIVNVVSGDKFFVEPGSLVLPDNMMVSDSFFASFLAQLPSKQECYRLRVDTSRAPLMVEQAAASVWKDLPVYYFGKQSPFDPARCEALTLQWPANYTLDHGLPKKMNELKDLKVYFSAAYAIQINHWFELQTATALFAREYVARTVGLAKRLLPERFVSLLLRWSWFSGRCNKIGKNCRIHPTAILEGCVIGDNVEIGPYTYLQSSVISDGAVLRENTTMKMSYMGPRSFAIGSDIVNAYIGADCSIFTPMLFNAVIGKGTFISGGSGFADFNAGSGNVTTEINGESIDSGLNNLGSCVGEDCFIGANMIFAPGRVIPNGSQFLDNGLIRDVPTQAHGTYVLSGNKFLQIPSSFIGAEAS